jgi:prolyl oligopeptidase
VLRRVGLVVVLAACAPTATGERPETRREAVVEVIHGTPVADPYRWLERIEEAPVREWVAAQDEHARAWLQAQPGRAELREQLRGAFFFDGRTAPARFGARVFYARRHRDAEKAVYYVADADGSNERVLVDPNAMGDDISVRWVQPSWDGRFAAYRVSVNAADAATLRIRDVESGDDRPLDEIAGARYAVPSWLPDGSGFYYTGLPTDPDIPPSELPGHAEVRFHRMGTPQSEDAVVYPALHDPHTFLHGAVSRDGRWLVVSISRGSASTDVYFRERASTGVWQPLAVGSPHHYWVFEHRGTFYVHTDDGAPRFRLLAVDPHRPGRNHWREVVPEGDGVLDEARVVGGELLLHWVQRAHSRLELRRLDGSHPRPLSLPGLGSIVAIVGQRDRDEAFFSFTSFTDPPRIHRLRVSTGQIDRWYDSSIEPGAPDIDVEQVWYRSRDGTPVSMFVVHRRGLELDGSHPTVLTGYGGFGVSLTPMWSPLAAWWTARDGVWAVPNLRGGGEYGEEWHRAGMLHAKQNVFDDFIAAAQWLIDRGYTSPEQLAIMGASNGGLLVGAAMTQRPDLFGAVVCGVPLLDMVRYHLFGAGKTWVSEYGSAEDPQQFRTLLAYSPYHHVRRNAGYPPLLMLAADSDDRVDPMHARKFTAALQWATPSDLPVLMRVEKNAGHGGSDLARARLEATVDVLTFLREQITRRPAGGARPLRDACVRRGGETP